MSSNVLFPGALPLASAGVGGLFFPGSCVINSFSLTHSPLRLPGSADYTHVQRLFKCLAGKHKFRDTTSRYIHNKHKQRWAMNTRYGCYNCTTMSFHMICFLVCLTLSLQIPNRPNVTCVWASNTQKKILKVDTQTGHLDSLALRFWSIPDLSLRFASQNPKESCIIVSRKWALVTVSFSPWVAQPPGVSCCFISPDLLMCTILIVEYQIEIE